jgi:hypothetical protein
MTPYLNIPLLRNVQTTRRHSRRVVWFLVICAMASGALLWRLTDLFFMQNSIFDATPEHAVAMVRFHPSQKTWGDLLSLLDQTPLISNRPLTVSDIQPFIKGEFAVFFDNQGNKSLAIKSSEKSLPRDLLDSLGITVQKIHGNLFLLSETLMPIGNEKKNIQNKGAFFFFNLIGSFALKTEENEWILGPISLKNNEVNVSLPSRGEITNSKIITPQNTIASLSIQGWTFSDSETISSSINKLTGFEENFLAFISNEKQANIILVKNSEENGISYLFSAVPTKTKEEMIRFLKQAVALYEPNIDRWTLKDGSIASELRADPSNISYEEVNVSGSPLVHFSTQNNSDLYFYQGKDDFFISDSESLASAFLNEDTSKINGICFVNLELARVFLQNKTFFSMEYIPMSLLNKNRVFEAEIQGNNIVFTIKN